MSTHIKETEIALTDRAWRIVRYLHGQPDDAGQFLNYHFIEHNCPKTHSWDQGAPSWVGHTATIVNRAMACGRCNRSPTAGIQAMFWFLKESR